MYKKFFNGENPLWKTMGGVFDLFILNILWLVCSIPIVTFGPSTTAACYALIQRARGEATSISKDFFKSFKLNLKQGIVIGLIVTLIEVFLGLDIYLSRQGGTGIFSFFLFFFLVLFVIWSLTCIYVFPLLAKFDRKTKEIFIWAFTMMFKHLLSSILMLVLIFIGLYLCYRLPGLIFIMFGLLFQFCCVTITAMLKDYLPKPARIGDEPESYDYNPKPQQSPETENASGDSEIPNDEAALYGYDPKEAEELLRESSDDSQKE